jgi:hypothetical protein
MASIERSSFSLNRWYFIFKFKGNFASKIAKRQFQWPKPKICGVFISKGRPLQVTDSGNPVS